MTTTDRLRAELGKVEEQVRTLNRRADELGLAIAEAEGDTLKAEWKRAVLAGDHEASQRAWLKVMARYRFDPNTGRVLTEAALREQEEINAEAERMRNSPTQTA